MHVFIADVLLTLVIDMFYVLIGNSDTSLLLFLKGHVNSDRMFKHFGKVVLINVTYLSKIA